jgi:hypothetical protein
VGLLLLYLITYLESPLPHLSQKEKQKGNEKKRERAQKRGHS